MNENLTTDRVRALLASKYEKMISEGPGVCDVQIGATDAHNVNASVAVLATRWAKTCALNEEQLRVLSWAAAKHDEGYGAVGSQSKDMADVLGQLADMGVMVYEGHGAWKVTCRPLTDDETAIWRRACQSGLSADDVARACAAMGADPDETRERLSSLARLTPSAAKAARDLGIEVAGS